MCKYRIQEHDGKFNIEIYVIEESCFLWNKKSFGSWERTNACGGRWSYEPIPQPLSKTFKSLKAAKKQIKKWKSEPTIPKKIYHEV
jgi:hypothetical protein